MKIVSVKTHPITVPLTVPRWTASHAVSSSDIIITEVRTDEGLAGYGQIHGGPQKQICEWVARLAEVAQGMDPLANLEVWEKLFSLTNPRPGGMRGSSGLPPPLPRAARPLIMAALGGIDIALWDLKGKAAGVPVYTLLGGTNAPVFTYATGGQYQDGVPLNACAAELAAFVAAGYRAVKLKVCGESMDEEVERIHATRDAIGSEPLLMLDMNAAYSLEECITFARKVERYNIFWLEEPLHWYLQPADFVKLAAATPIALAHGERELTRFTARDFIVSGALRFMQFDSTRSAGFTESLRVAALAEQFGVRIAPHQAPELHAHLCSAFPNASFGVETNGSTERDPLWHDMYARRPKIKDSYVYLENSPGFGIELNWDFMSKYRAS